MTNQSKGFIAITTTALILGTFGIWIRLLSGTFSDAGQVLARSFFATIIITLIVVWRRFNPFAIEKKYQKYVLAFSLVFPLSVICFTVSANQIKVSNSLFMLYVGSLVSTALFGKFLFKEKFGFKHILSLILVFIGLLFFIYPFSIESITVGLILGIASGIFEGSAHTLRKLMKGLKREVVVFWQSFSGIIVATLFFFISSEPLIRNFSISGILVAALFGFLLVVIGYLLVYGFNNFDVNLGTIILATELFFALIINALVLKEVPTKYEVFGGVLIFSGAIVTSLKLTGLSKNNRKPN